MKKILEQPIAHIIHIIQKDCQPSAVNTFVEALSICHPAVAIRAPILKYLGKSHNLWHR